MTLNLSVVFPAALMILVKWTALLALGWVAHGLLRNRHSRWRVILWRSMLCFTLLLPLWYCSSVPTLKIPVPALAHSSVEFPELLPSVTGANADRAVSRQAPVKPAETAATPEKPGAVPVPAAPRRFPWSGALLLLWGAGAAMGLFRLMRLQVRLSRLRNDARPATADLEQRLREIQDQLGVGRAIGIKVSDAITSPFVCGLFKPSILLPAALVKSLSPIELSAILRHEIAHFRRNDLAWCVGWRWLSVIGWFHPLVWMIPAAHNLACEQEADRIASGQSEDRRRYAQLLAQLALRVLALPPVETRLTVNGTSQIARRLNHLLQEGMGAWKWKHSAAGFCLAGGLFLLAAGCQFSEDTSAASKGPAAITFKELSVVVVDEAGQPVEGALIVPNGFRVKGPRRVDGHGWNKRLFGDPVKVTTDREGKARVRYPVEGVPDEKLLVGDVIFSVFHPEFCTTRLQEFPVDGSANPIRLRRGVHVQVSAYFGSDRQPVPEFIPNISGEGIRSEDWQKKENGVQAINRISPGGHMLQLMGRLPSGEIVYNEGLTFKAEPGIENNFAVEVKPGIRLEGRIDEKVPRPVKNGRVLISVRPREFPAYVVPEEASDLYEQYGYPRFWHSYRQIAEDGTFVFESIPPGDVDVIVHGDGFVSKNGGEPKNRVQPDRSRPAFIVSGLVIGVPQAFPLASPLTKIEVVTEPTATLEVIAKTKKGEPVEGATVYVNPNVMRMSASGIFGNIVNSSEEPYRSLLPLPDIPYSAETDKDGRAVLRNVPAVTTHGGVYHNQFEVPISAPHELRSIRISLLPGQTKELPVTLQPKGKQFIGAAR